MNEHDTPLLSNCGPSPRERMRTSPIGALRVIRPLERVAMGLQVLGARLGAVEGEAEDARLAALFRGAVPPVADALGYRLRIGPRSAPRTLALRLWEALREDGRLVPLAGIVRRYSLEEIQAGNAPQQVRSGYHSTPRGGVDPRGGKARPEMAAAAGMALLFPAVAVPPLLLWRREPDPVWSAYTDVWTVRQLHGGVPAELRDPRIQ